MQQTGTLAATAPDGLLSADEFMELPLNLKLYELVCGVLVEVPITGYEHGEIESNIIRLLVQHIRPRGLGQITPGDVMFRLERNPIRYGRPTCPSFRPTGYHRASSDARIARSYPTSPWKSAHRATRLGSWPQKSPTTCGPACDSSGSLISIPKR